MKIHTTQNLTSIRELSANSLTPREVRYDYLEQSRLQRLGEEQDVYQSKPSFKRNMKIVKRSAEEIKKAASKENKFKKWVKNTKDKILSSGFFDRVLDFMGHEVFVQAAISFVVCALLRPITTMGLALFDKASDIGDYIFSASHSICSAFAGIVSAICLATPFSKGAKHLNKHMIQHLDVKMLKQMYPNLKEDSIWKDAAKKERKAIEEWLDVQGNIFNMDFKNVMKVAKPKYIADVSEKTLKSLGADVDKKAMGEKSVNEWTDRNGNKLHFDLKDMFVQVDEGGSNPVYFSLKHANDETLEKLFENLDIKSVNKDGQRLHTDFWKNKDGSEFKLDMDTIQLSSYKETADATPLYTGATRIEKPGTKSEKVKYASYQRNNGEEDKLGVPDKLGSEIKQEWLDAGDVNDVKYRLLTWFPDIISRPFVAAGTIAFLPWVLKTVFGLEKGKNKKKPEAQVAKEIKMEPATGNKEIEINAQASRKAVA